MPDSTNGSDAPLALRAAVRANDAEQVREVLARFPQLIAHLDEAMPDAGFGATPLIAAAHQKNREMIDVLLDAGANINQRTHWWAGGFGVLDSDPDIARYLIERGATIDAHDAARLGLIDTLQELVAVDPTVLNARFGDGQTPLHVASSVEIAAFLIDNGADIDALDVDHESTPAQYLVRDQQDVVRYLISRGCRTDILMASAVGDLDLVNRHLDEDPGSIWTAVSPRYFPMKNPQAGGTIYIWTLGQRKLAHVIAREFGHDDVLALLMQHMPPALKLALACESGDESMIETPGASNAELVSDLSDELLTRLPAAAALNDSGAVRRLLAAGWPVDATNEEGATALHWAAFFGNADLVRDLLQRGAAVNVKENAFHSTPGGWAEHGAEHCWQRKDGDYPAVIESISAAGGM